MAGGGPISNGAAASSYEPGKSYAKPFATVTFLFFMWGFLTCMNDILIPSLRGVFDLSITQSMLIQFAFFGAYFIGSVIYFVISANTGDPITKIGYKNGIIIGLLIAALGCFLFYPAAIFEAYGLFLSALFILGLGFTMLQIAANPYVAILGSPESASGRLNLAQGFNSFGTTIAPILGGHLIYSFFAEEVGGVLKITVNSVQAPYLIFAGVFLLLAAVIKFVNLPRFTSEDVPEKGMGALKYRHLVLGMGAIFMYVGGEVAIGSILINFFNLENIMGMEEAEGKTFLAFYWGGAMIGRFLGAISLSEIDDAVKKLAYMALAAVCAFGVIYGAVYLDSGIAFSEITPFLALLVINYFMFILGKSLAGRTLAIFSAAVIALLFVTIFTEGSVAFWAVIGIGLFNSIMWSNIFTLAIKDLGKHTGQGSSLLVMAILGGALIPLVQGAVADVFATPDNKDAGIQISFFVPMLCYVYILYYGYKGHKPVKTVE